MKILLIAPSSRRWRNIGRSGWFNGRTFRFSMLSLLTVAAETPPGADIQIIDDVAYYGRTARWHIRGWNPAEGEAGAARGWRPRAWLRRVFQNA